MLATTSPNRAMSVRAQHILTLQSAMLCARKSIPLSPYVQGLQNRLTASTELAVKANNLHEAEMVGLETQMRKSVERHEAELHVGPC